MNAKTLQDYCRTLPGATEDIKWGNDLVFSVGGRMFAGFDAEGGPGIGFPCSDDDFDALTERPGIIPAPYAARFGWVSVTDPKSLPQAEARKLLHAAYRLVVAKLPKRTREAIGQPPATRAKPGKRPRR